MSEWFRQLRPSSRREHNIINASKIQKHSNIKKKQAFKNSQSFNHLREWEIQYVKRMGNTIYRSVHVSKVPGALDIYVVQVVMNT